MFSPPGHFSDIPPLVDPNGSFIPPPPGVSQGGQPGFLDAFPGAAAAQNGYPWPTQPAGTPYPQSAGALPNWGQGPFPSPGVQPNSAASWTFGQYPPFNATTPALSWTAQTPAASYGPLTPAMNVNPFGGGGYTPWSAPAVQQQQAYTSAYAPAIAQDSITAGGFFGGGPSGAVANGQGMQLGWEVPQGKGRRKRSNSMKKANATPLQKSLSAPPPFGASAYPSYTPWGYMPPYQLGPETYGPKNLGRRPRDWRADYNPRGGFASYIPNLMGKSRSDVQEYNDPHRRTLHPLLQWNSQNPPTEHDLRENPLFADAHTLFLNLNRPHNNIDFAQLTTQPAAVMMRLYHPSLPWYIDVRQSHPNGVTVHDVLTQMWRQLMTPINGRHFWNEDLSNEDRTAISVAFQDRCQNDPAEIQRGVVQVDYMGRKVVFEGLLRGRNGMWEIKTSRLDPEER